MNELLRWFTPAATPVLPPSIVITTGIMNAEKEGRKKAAQASETNMERPNKDVETPQETAHLIHKTSKSRDSGTRGKTPKIVPPTGVEVYVEVQYCLD